MRGSRLKKAQSASSTTTYDYDVNGLRTKKVLNSGTSAAQQHDYIYAGGKLMRESWTQGGENCSLDFFYDLDGNPYIVFYTKGNSRARFYYLTNLQGDVVGLLNTSSQFVAKYHYDPFGKVSSVENLGSGALADTIANVNPLRYRGYYFDSETEWYYLQSRYYDPALGRFLNADSYASTGQSFLGYNMFAYCNNNPVAMSDTEGSRPYWEGKHGEYTDEGKSHPNIVYNSNPHEDAPQDITEELDAKMAEHVEELKAYSCVQTSRALLISALLPHPTTIAMASLGAEFSLGIHFSIREETGGKWDLKNNDYPSSKRFVYKGNFYTGEDIGNIHYGYVGAAIYGPIMLRLGAGGYQLLSGANLSDWRFFFDSARDFAMVGYGINLYHGG